MVSKFVKFVLSISLLAVVVTPFAYAQNEESEEARQAAEKAKRRRYPGGRDEQELTVQAVLPVTTRYPESPKPVTPGQKNQSNDDEVRD